jgi:energy-coupling factor transporter ATP-binding protein EcfA2
MKSLFRGLTRSSVEAGAALPQVFQSFKDNGIKFLPGELVMFAGPPGAGKSALALNYLLGVEDDNLYISSDMAEHLLVWRLLSIKTGETEEQIDAGMKTTEGFDRYSKLLRSVDYMYTDYPARPDAETIASSIMQCMEVLGEPPPIVTLDNLMDVNTGNDNEWAAMRETAQVLKFIAKELDICVIALHHTQTGVSDLSRPVPMSHIMGKISELPATILTVAKRPGELLYAPVKNRHGKADASAKIVLSLDYDETTQRISDPTPKEVYQDYRHYGESYSDWRDRAD